MKHTIRNPLLDALLFASLAATGLPAIAAEEQAAEELEAVVVTGSRIPTLRPEGPSPVTVISAEDMSARGFTTVQEAVNSLTQVTGTAQNEGMALTFTQNANSLELRGMGPGRTLVLVDGRRVADYPLPYNGESNFVNLSAIPAAAVDRVELLSSGASAIYGSDAVAGVLNIVLKKRADSPLSVDLRYGDTTQGGGESLRAQLVTGGESGNLGWLVAAEVFDRKPVYAFQRDFQDSLQDNPFAGGRINARTLLRMDPYDWDEDGITYVDPGEAACEPFAQSMEYSFRPGSGYYCGQDDQISQYTLRNARKRGSIFARSTYALDRAELHASVNAYTSSDWFDPNYSWFSSEFIVPGGWDFFDVSEDPMGIGGSFTRVQRYFQPWEIGGHRARQEHFNEDMLDFSVGIRGPVGTSAWTYDLTLGGSEYRLKDRRPLLVSQRISDYFFGPQLRDGDGELMYEQESGVGMPMHAVDWGRVYSPLTPQLWRQLTEVDVQRADSDNRAATLVLNGDLLDLPAGPLATAWVFEAGRQSYGIEVSDMMANGEFFESAATTGNGTRRRYAAGLEAGIPVTSMLRLQLAGRYDHYDDITAVDGAFTWNAGLEFRPFRQLLVRGTRATSFRAPDMHYVFADPSSFFVVATDEYLCRRDEPGVPLSACTSDSGLNVGGAREGNPFLTEEKGRSWTAGFVYEPLRNLRLSADYYHITLKGGVQDDSVGLLLQTEADCRLGETMAGNPVDSDSLKCQSALARVQRRPVDISPQSEFLQAVTVGPINTALQRTAGIDAAVSYGFHAPAALGRFDLGASFTQVLKNERVEFAGDAVEDLLENRAWPDWHSRMSGSLTWSKNAFSGTLHVQRYGRIWNWAEDTRLPAYLLTNLSARYSGLLGGEAYVGFAIQNLFDRNPPRDATWDAYPYYSEYNYSPIGREVFLEIGTRF